jgi:hypothetical protein
MSQKAWSVNDTPITGGSTSPIRGGALATDGPLGKQGFCVFVDRLNVLHQQNFAKEAIGTLGETVIETGSLRLSGINGWAYGRRVNVLGEFRSDTTVTLEMNFDDQGWVPTDKFSWALTTADYAAGDAVFLELTLPVMLFNSVTFRLSWSNPLDADETFWAHGLTVFYDPAEEGPRVFANQKG